MSGYSVDLRERIVKAWEAGKTQQWIAQTYRVSISSVKRYIGRYKSTGNVVATEQRRMEPRINQSYEAALRELVVRWPKAKLEQYGAIWQQETGMVVSDKTMSRDGLATKKRRWARVNGMNQRVRIGANGQQRCLPAVSW